jgi:diacylglycerol kinase family enzyme
MMNGRPFLNVGGVGFDATVSHAFHQSGRAGGRRGLMSYVRLSLREMALYRAPRLVIETPVERLEAKPFVLCLANGPQYGSGAVINPGGRLDDGRMEAIVIEDASIARLLLSAPRLFLGGIERIAGYRRLSATRLMIRGEGPLMSHRDGDPEPDAERIEVTLEPRALTIVAPASTLEDAAGPFVSGAPGA